MDCKVELEHRILFQPQFWYEIDQNYQTGWKDKEFEYENVAPYFNSDSFVWMDYSGFNSIIIKAVKEK